MEVKAKWVQSPKVKKLLKKISKDAQDRIRSIIAIELRNSTLNRFRTELDPQGVKWKERSPRYLEYLQRIGKRTKILTFDGNLRKSIGVDVVGDNIEIGIPASTIYGKKHQLGEDGMPKREFLGVSAQDRRIIMKILKKELKL